VTRFDPSRLDCLKQLHTCQLLKKVFRRKGLCVQYPFPRQVCACTRRRAQLNYESIKAAKTGHMQICSGGNTASGRSSASAKRLLRDDLAVK
jgi:hypothetical protein